VGDLAFTTRPGTYGNIGIILYVPPDGDIYPQILVLTQRGQEAWWWPGNVEIIGTSVQKQM
jgi:hypothetical protein